MRKALDLLNLSGKVAIVTGGNAGIGLSTVQFLLHRGAKVYMGARNETKARGAIKGLEEEGLGSLGGTVAWLDLDLSHPKSAKAAADVVLQNEKRLDILVNNAAMLVVPYKMSEYGIVDSMVVNHISPYLFTRTLLPLLKTTAAESDADVRIVNVTSEGHSMPKDVIFKDKESLNRRFGDSTYNDLTRYDLSKLANILHSRLLQRSFNTENVNITCISVHPGTVSSPGVHNMLTRNKNAFFGSVLTSLSNMIFLNEHDGAMTSAFAAASVEVANDRERYKGSYLIPFGKMGKASKQAEDPKLAEDLHEVTESVLREMGL